jgi:hypothetical protein
VHWPVIEQRQDRAANVATTDPVPSPSVAGAPAAPHLAPTSEAAAAALS